jgi:predicted Zn-ribbon and HTH transcriptional regulator
MRKICPRRAAHCRHIGCKAGYIGKNEDGEIIIQEEQPEQCDYHWHQMNKSQKTYRCPKCGEAQPEKQPKWYKIR